MRTALPIPAFARGHARRVAAIQLGPPRRQAAYHFTIDRCRSDPNAFVEAMLREIWMPSPRTAPPIDWSALPSGEIVMAPVGNAMSGQTRWRDIEA